MTAQDFAAYGASPTPTASPPPPPPSPPPAPQPKPSAAPAFPSSTTPPTASSTPSGPAFPGTTKPAGLTAASFAGYQAPKKPPSALALVGDYLDTPWFLMDAASRRHDPNKPGYDPAPNWGEVAKVFHQLGPGQIDDIAQRYNLTSPEQLRDQAAQGDAYAGWLLKHPKAGGLTQFLAEFANPTNAGVGRVVGGVAHVAAPALEAAAKIPAVAAAGRAAQDAWSPTAGLAREGGVQSEAIGRKLSAARNEADAEARKRLDPIFKDTTPQQRIEIERRSEVDDKGQYLNPPRLGMVETARINDAEITARARAFRAALTKLDEEQLAAGTADPTKMMVSQSYTPRYGAGYGKVYEQPHDSPEVADYYENTNRGGSGGSYRVGTLNERKRYLTHDQAEASGLLSKDYDPANNLTAHFRQRLGNIKQNDAVKEFAGTGQLEPLTYRHGDVEGQGPEGYKDVMGAVDKTAGRLGKLAASAATGLPIARRITTTGAFLARMQEAARNSARAKKMADHATGMAGRVTSQATQALAAQADDIESKAQEILGKATSSAVERARAQRDLTQVQLFRQRMAAEQRLGARLPGGTVANTKLSSTLGAALGGARRLSPAQKTLASIDRPAQRIRDAAAKGVQSAEGVQQLASDALKANVARIGARSMKDVHRIAAPAAAMAGRLFRADRQAANRTTALALRLAGARITAQDAATFRQAVNDAVRGVNGAPGIAENLRRSVRTDAERQARAAGRVTDIPQQLRSMPALQHSSVTPALAEYLRKFAAAPEDADAMSHVIDTINKLARIGIISNPVVHILWNLNNQFLGAGGGLRNLAQLYNPAYKIPDALMREAEANGAFVHFGASTRGLGAIDYGKLIGSSEGLNPLERLDRATTHLWDANQHFVFDYAEKRIAATLYQTKKAQRLREGLDEATAGKQAGIDVRKALGDYANVSRSGIEHNLNKALFFYPWLKTIIPFWAQTLVESPQWVNAPLEGIRANNELGGDPNMDKERAGSMYLGSDAQGNPRYFSTPLPQFKALADLFEMIAPQGDLGGDVTPRVNALSRIGESHLNPVAGAGLDTLLTAVKEPDEPGGANLTTMFDKDAPLSTQVGQEAENAFGRALPLPIAVKQFAQYLGTLPGRPDPLGDLGGMAVGGVIGGTDYARSSPNVEKALYRLREAMHRQVNEARKLGDKALAAQIYQQYETMMQSLTKGTPQAVTANAR